MNNGKTRSISVRCKVSIDWVRACVCYAHDIARQQSQVQIIHDGELQEAAECALALQSFALNCCRKALEHSAQLRHASKDLRAWICQQILLQLDYEATYRYEHVFMCTSTLERALARIVQRQLSARMPLRK
jgi:hypothetical protein